VKDLPGNDDAAQRDEREAGVVVESVHSDVDSQSAVDTGGSGDLYVRRTSHPFVHTLLCSMVRGGYGWDERVVTSR
jgi:hypothetical protein